jgi:hypothetical protein
VRFAGREPHLHDADRQRRLSYWPGQNDPMLWGSAMAHSRSPWRVSRAIRCLRMISSAYSNG